MFSSSKGTKDKKQAKGIVNSLSLIIDIESGLVRAALVLYARSQVPRVLCTVSSPIVRKPKRTKLHDDFLGAMVRALNDVTTHLANKSLPELREKGFTQVISKVNCVLSTPWIISKTKTVKINYGKETEITRELVKKIIDTEHQELENKFKADHAASGDGSLLEYDLEFIEQKIFEIKLNGYAVANVYGKRAKEIEVSFAVTVSSKDILNQIHETIATTLNVVSIRGIYGVNGHYVDEYHSSLLLQYSAFRNLVKMRNDYIAAHVHNDLSDIIVVRGGVCSILASFPFGMSTFVKKTSSALNQPETLAYSALSMNAQQKLTPESHKEISSASDPIIREWASQFFQTLSTVSDLDQLPRTLILSVQDHFPYFEKALKDQRQGESLTITALDEVLLEKAVAYERGQDTNALVSMYVFALNSTI